MKTIKQVVDEIVNKNKTSLEEDTIEKIICMAYYIGFEKGTVITAKQYNAILTDQIQRAKECRYHKLAMKIQGNIHFSYNSSYDEIMTSTFGDDLTNLFDNEE